MPDTLPFFDGHNDTLLRLYRPEPGEARDFFLRSDIGHIDLPRAQEGGFAGGFFAVFVPPRHAPPPRSAPRAQGLRAPLATPLDCAYAQREAMGMTAKLFALETASAGQFRVVRQHAELEANLQANSVSAILHFEGADPIDPDLEALEVFYQAGLRSLGLVWSRPNAFACGVPFAFPSSADIGPGLSEVGKELVKACNRLGIMLDLSHLNEKGFWDVAQLSQAPLVATHSNVHALCPSSRNLNDKQLEAIGDSEGMVGLNFALAFLDKEGQSNPELPLSVMVEHVDYLVDKLGIEHVGLGSDFDGAGIPAAIGDVTGVPHLFNALRQRGYDDDALRKLAYENWFSLLKRTWQA